MADQTKNVIVTGAARGLGAAAVRKLAARGVNVVAVDRLSDQLGELKKEPPSPLGGVKVQRTASDGTLAGSDNSLSSG